MKKAILFFSFILCLAVSCTNEIGPIPYDEPQKLIINAMLNAGKPENTIYLHLSDPVYPQIVRNGIIRLYINNDLTDTVTECTYHADENFPLKEYPYYTHCSFKSGDHVRIEASTRDGKFRAEAVTTVHEPLQVLKLDTFHMKSDTMNVEEQSYVNKQLRLKVRLKVPASGQTQYYRVQLRHDYTLCLTNYITDQDSIYTFTAWGCNGNEDIALSDGKPGHNHVDSDIEFIPPQRNDYSVFSDVFFTNQEYTMTLNAYISYCWDHTLYKLKSATCNGTLQFFAISPNEYRYLRAASAYTDYDDSNPLTVPVIFPNNIKGGIGIFAIENPYEYSFLMKGKDEL